jgi:hypothetical protein
VVLSAVLDKPFDESLLPEPTTVPMDVLQEYGTVVEAPGVGAIEGVFVEQDPLNA